MKQSVWKGASLHAGNGHCPHLNLIRRIGQPGLPANFRDPFKVTAFPLKGAVAPHPSERRSPKPHSYSVGDLIAGKYRVHQIFEGGMGRVFVVRDTAEPFVLKSLKHQDASEDVFLDEARSWVRVGRHDNIVPAFWVDRVGGMLCIAAEYVPPDAAGRTSLRDALRLGPPSLQQIVNWSAHFCYGMEHANDRGIRAHRDIKPENLLLGRSEALQITDFGIAAASPLEWPDSELLRHDQQKASGTPAYMPPEQWAGESRGFPTDVYAFGLVMHELAFGRLPWSANTIVELRHAHFSGVREVAPHPLREIIKRAIAPASADRFSTPQELLDALAEVGERRELSLPPRPLPREEQQDELLAQASLGATGNREHALAAAQLLTERWPTFSAGWTQLGRLWLEEGETEKAREATQQALRTDATRSAPWSNMGLIHERLANHEEAIRCFKAAIERDAHNTGAMSNMSSSLVCLGRREEAKEILERALSIAPDKPNLWFNLGSVCRAIGNTTGAEDCFQNALARTPESHRVELARMIEAAKGPSTDAGRAMNLATLLKEGNFKEAVLLLLNAADERPDDARIWHNLALVYRQQGLLEQAQTALLRLRTLEPRSAFAIGELMSIAKRMGAWEEAHRYCDEFASLPGMIAESKARRARIYADAGDMPAARRLLIQAMQEHPEHVNLFITFGDLALRSGAPSAAATKGYGRALRMLRGREDSAAFKHVLREYGRAVEAAKSDAAEANGHDPAPDMDH